MQKAAIGWAIESSPDCCGHPSAPERRIENAVTTRTTTDVAGESFTSRYRYSDTMTLDLVNPYVTKILLALADGDSIRHVSRKVGASYSYTHEWVVRLEELGVVERNDGVHLADEALADAFEAVAKAVLRRDLDLDDAYLLPNFGGLDYRYTKTDAVYVWTRGGYQIGRNRDDYPIFLDVLGDDLPAWRAFFEGYGVETTVGDRRDDGDGVYFVLFPQDDFDAEWVDSAAVAPLEETVAWAREYEANFQPALEMLDREYDLGLDVEYREREVL